MSASLNPRLLDGIRVLDFSQYVAGAGASRMMAELGAEIIKVEQTPVGDPSRLVPFIKDGRSGFFIQQNRGKQSLGIDLKQPRAKTIIHELVKHCDLVLENFGPGVMEKHGFDYPTLARLNPKLIMVSVSAFGRDSPLSHKTGYDLIAQGFSGYMHMTGPRDGAPHPVGLSFADANAAVHAFAAIGYALYHRECTGAGQYLDLSMIDCMFHLHEISLQAHSVSGGTYVPHRMGSHHELVCPGGAYKGPTGYMVIMALQPQWERVCRALQKPEWLDDPRFATNEARARNQQVLIPLIEAWLATFSRNEEALAVLEEHRVPCAPVLSPVDAVGHDYFVERGTIRTTHDPVIGDVRVPGFPFKFSAQPDLPDFEAPLFGEHNTAILRRVLGYTDERIKELAATGVLVSKDR